MSLLTAALGEDGDYYQCPDCGFKQRSNAQKRIKCHRCGRSYERRTAKRVEKAPDRDLGAGFVQFSNSQ